jgi:DNA invertase Pin-like site-specific DNA recombinase
MSANSAKSLLCAIYTRKSTDHGLELEFNSLDAQREACEAYIKSQALEGWRVLPDRYDDAAYSGGSLERPALQQLVTDIDAGKVNAVVVYKIDRLTRSLADFAKLVEVFDRKGISFVAVTQQFNTSTSMGRLTLNVLLSFAQFERELASERVRDKVAASRRKGKWTGGGVPLGYNVLDKKLVVNAAEAESVRYIFRRYTEHKCLRLLNDDLNSRGIVTKRRTIKGRQSGGSRFTYGPLAYLLKNRAYLGEIGHKGEWFAGEHEPIIERTTFDEVQSILKGNSVARQQKCSTSMSLLAGLLYDDRGNRMTPTYSTKRGVRYRFYVSATLLSGRRDMAGSVRRVSAPDLEHRLLSALRDRFGDAPTNDRDAVLSYIEKVALQRDKIEAILKTDVANEKVIEIDYAKPEPDPRARIDTSACRPGPEPDVSVLQALARAHYWLNALSERKYDSIEGLAADCKWHPKVIRKTLRLAFLAPDIVQGIILGRYPKSVTVSTLQNIAAQSWQEQRRQLPVLASV